MKNLHDILPADPIPGYVVEEIILESFPHVLYLAKRKKRQRNCRIENPAGSISQKKEHLASIRREYQIISHLQEEKVIKVNSLISYGNGKPAIEMERFGISLAQHLAGFSNQVLPLDQFFSIAIPLVKSLGKIHEKAIVHKDLVPRNILVDPETLDIRLIDFSAASELSREHQDVAILNNIEGSLPTWLRNKPVA